MNDGGPAFPQSETAKGNLMCAEYQDSMGMSLRDWFAGQCQEDDRLVKCIRAMDDTALLVFARSPSVEREEWITDTGELCGANVFAGKSEVEKVIRRLLIEASAIARVRYMQADAMLVERDRKESVPA